MPSLQRQKVAPQTTDQQPNFTIKQVKAKKDQAKDQSIQGEKKHYFKLI